MRQIPRDISSEKTKPQSSKYLSKLRNQFRSNSRFAATFSVPDSAKLVESGRWNSENVSVERDTPFQIEIYKPKNKLRSKNKIVFSKTSVQNSKGTLSSLKTFEIWKKYTGKRNVIELNQEELPGQSSDSQANENSTKSVPIVWDNITISFPHKQRNSVKNVKNMAKVYPLSDK